MSAPRWLPRAATALLEKLTVQVLFALGRAVSVAELRQTIQAALRSQPDEINREAAHVSTHDLLRTIVALEPHLAQIGLSIVTANDTVLP